MPGAHPEEFRISQLEGYLLYHAVSSAAASDGSFQVSGMLGVSSVYGNLLRYDDVGNKTGRPLCWFYFL